MTEYGDETNQVIGVALEHNGGELARPFVEKAGASFPVLVDEDGLTSSRLGFKAVPNGVLVDENGMIRWEKYGGFSVENDEDVDVVRRFFAGEEIEPRIQPDAAYMLNDESAREIDTLVQQGHQFIESGQTAAAVDHWRQALHKDPENLVIRKQIWAAEHPEKFHPTIDWDWQKVQLKREREDEIAQGVCGPDGCPLPGFG